MDDQIWFAENLAFEIPGKSWAYDDCDSMAIVHGLLYEFDAADKACPKGWRLPTLQDWQKLFSYLGMKDDEISIKEPLCSFSSSFIISKFLIGSIILCMFSLLLWSSNLN